LIGVEPFDEVSLRQLEVYTVRKQTTLFLWFLLFGAQLSCAARTNSAYSTSAGPASERELLELSRTKWRLMAERNVDSLAALFHPQAVFVHMGGTMSRAQELETIRSGMIQYKQADIHAASVRFAGNTAIVLNTIRLVAIVGGNEVVNPFEVTEVYVRDAGNWRLVSLSFTRLLR
jgi:hypothetical protein